MGGGSPQRRKGSHAPELCFWEKPGTTSLVPTVNRLPVFHNAENMETSKVTNCRAGDLTACDSGPWDGSPTQTTSLRNFLFPPSERHSQYKTFPCPESSVRMQRSLEKVLMLYQHFKSLYHIVELKVSQTDTEV